MVNVDQPQAAVASTLPETPPYAPLGFEDFFRASFRELVRAAMYAGATKEEGEDAAAKALSDILRHWGIGEWSLSYARKAAVHNFIKDRTRGTPRLAKRLIERGHVPHDEGTKDSRLTAWEDEEWVAQVLSCLPPAQREVMECIARGLDRDEIAEALGKTKEAVRRNLCDARARLARELDQDREHDQQPRELAGYLREEAR